MALAVLIFGGNNENEVKSTTFENISKTYEVNFKSEDLVFNYDKPEGANDRRVSEVTTEYNDFASGTKYELTFAFQDNKTPVLMKTATVTDELIAKMRK